jgi:hypothetical protein
MARRPRTCVAFALSVSAFATTGGCGVGESLLPADFASCPAEETPTPAEGLTYWHDIKPILDARCAGCHTDGGLAPFSLTTYEDAFQWSDLAALAVEEQRMPPWQPNDCCAPYRWKRSISAEERATFNAWVAQGAPAGDPADEGPPLDRDDSELARVDLTLRMPAPYTPVPTIGVDDVRCFLLEWPVDEQVYVTGIDVRPGNRTVVHHVATLVIDREDTADLRARDSADEEAGFDCSGFGNLDVLPTGSIGGWTPGDRALTLPGGLGRKVEAGSAILLQIHYDTGHGVLEPDLTELDLMIEREVEREAQGVAVGNPQWLLDGGMRIAAGDPDAMFWFAYDPTTVLTKGEPFLVWSVNLHMHELGARGSIAILRRDGTTECLLDIDDWDFGWLSDYWLAEPVRVDPGDRLYVECHFDNTAENQKIVNGELQTPRDLGWGTDMEMCGGILQTSAVVP